MTTHQINHFVPASYFRPWCGPDGKLVYFKWHGDRFLSDRANPKYIAREPHLYALHGAPMKKASIIETKFFTPLIDEPGASIHQALLTGSTNSLSPEKRHQWVRYLMALRVRTPEVIEKVRKLGSERVRFELSQSQDEYDAIKPNGAPSTMEECIEPWFLDNFGLARVIPEVIGREDTRNAIVAMHWWCQDFSDCAADLLTSDRPLIWHNGVHDDGFFLAFPLSPKIGFFVAKNMSTRNKLCALPLRDLVRKFNESIVSNASEYVYASHDGARKFIQKRLRHT